MPTIMVRIKINHINVILVLVTSTYAECYPLSVEEVLIILNRLKEKTDLQHLGGTSTPPYQVSLLLAFLHHLIFYTKRSNFQPTFRPAVISKNVSHSRFRSELSSPVGNPEVNPIIQPRTNLSSKCAYAVISPHWLCHTLLVPNPTNRSRLSINSDISTLQLAQPLLTILFNHGMFSGKKMRLRRETMS